MSALTAARKSARLDTFQIRFFIGNDVYTVFPLPSQGREKSFAMTKQDGTRHETGADDMGPYCDCPGWHYRSPKPCRHIRALRAARMID